MLVRSIKKQLQRDHAVHFVAIIVAAHGLYILADTLVDQIIARHGLRVSSLLIDLPLFIGLSVIYLSTLLYRRKQTAWAVTIVAYTFYLGINVAQLLSRLAQFEVGWLAIIRALILPLVILGMLIAFKEDFVVKSDIQGFKSSLRFVVAVLLAALIYGIVGFELMDKSDFHQEIPPVVAAHYTIDQFNLTTTKPIQPYTKRARLFVDSLSFVSLAAIIYAAFSLFQPLKARFGDQSTQRDKMLALLTQYGAPSEEFFKLWPHDKQYFFDASEEAGLAFHVYSGVALCLSDPIGNTQRFDSLTKDFLSLCFNNDWLPAMVHVTPAHAKLYSRSGFTLQKLGQEAVVDIYNFENNVRQTKYFRQILNRFNKQGYTFELLKPPHHRALVDRLKIISDEWLSKGGRSERGFVMGYFRADYLEMCDIFVARDAAGTVQAFTNLVPAPFDSEEATYDMLRQSDQALGNVNDYLLINLISVLAGSGYKRLNMGLSPLAGLEAGDSEQTGLLDNVLRFAYANGDRFYSFKGLYKFKDKYEPDWQDRFIAYKGGLRGFSKTMTALTRCMSKVVKL